MNLLDVLILRSLPVIHKESRRMGCSVPGPPTSGGSGRRIPTTGRTSGTSTTTARRTLTSPTTSMAWRSASVPNLKSQQSSAQAIDVVAGIRNSYGFPRHRQTMHERNVI